MACARGRLGSGPRGLGGSEGPASRLCLYCAGLRARARPRLFPVSPGRGGLLRPWLFARGLAGVSPCTGRSWSHALRSPEFGFLCLHQKGRRGHSSQNTPTRAVLSIPSGVFSLNSDHLPSPFSEGNLLQSRDKKSRLERRLTSSLSGHAHSSVTQKGKF